MKLNIPFTLSISLCIQILLIHTILLVGQSYQQDELSDQYQQRTQHHHHHQQQQQQQQQQHQQQQQDQDFQQQQADSDATDTPEISDESKKVIIEQVKANLLKVLGLKEAPKKPHNRAYVPQAMLEEYRKLRDSVRETIPEDRDFYGKIAVADLDSADRENFWNSVYHKFGTYDLMVDMDDSGRRQHYEGDAWQMSALPPQGDPQTLPSSINQILLPYIRGKRQFSVHLRFNLSQELFVRPIEPEDIKRAELRLTREKLLACHLGDCSKDDTLSNRHPNIKITTKNTQPIPRFQLIHLYQVLGYDSHNDPMTRSPHSSLRVDTSESNPLILDIHDIILDWIKDGSKNYGIIIRVTNEDNYEHNSRQVRTPVKTSEISNASITFTSTNSPSSPTNEDDEPISFGLEDHVRLKRAFRLTSESEFTWERNRPSILIWFLEPASDPSRRHVKRDHSAAAGEIDPADVQDSSLVGVQSSTSSHDASSTQNSPSADRQPLVNIAKGSPVSPAMNSRHKHSASNGQLSNKSRERQVSLPGQQGRSGAGRATSISSSNGSQQKPRPKHKSSKADDKCGKRQLSINFDEVGWSSWIIAPQAYFANYCYGDCTLPMADNANATNHAIIQSIFHSVGRIVPRSCCAPTKLGRMAILYQLDGGVQMRHYDDMIVESCGCL